jgi:hypothetical protein
MKSQGILAISHPANIPTKTFAKATIKTIDIEIIAFFFIVHSPLYTLIFIKVLIKI